MFKDLQVIDVSRIVNAVGFVKSRKSHDKTHAMCHEISDYILSKGIYIQDFIVDESAGTDIDRSAIDKLMDRLEQGGNECVVVLSVFDFTKDIDDLVQFFIHLSHLDCKLYSIEEERFIPFEFEGEE